MTTQIPSPPPAAPTATPPSLSLPPPAPTHQSPHHRVEPVIGAEPPTLAIGAPSDPTTTAALEHALLHAIAWLPPGPADRDTSSDRDTTSGAPHSSPGEVTLLWQLFDAQVTSRHLDVAARRLRAEHQRGYYTIGSAGHEANAAIAMALRPTDPALLHYRSGGFYVARAHQVGGHQPVDDVLLGMLAATDEPIAGGRHKVFGHRELAIIPQTSTIASHLPRAVGMAMFLGDPPTPLAWPADSVVVCSFGDASANHSTAVGAINLAGHGAHQGRHVPLLLVCEDNGLGISVPTPAGWIEAAFAHRPGLDYMSSDGTDPTALLATAEEAVGRARTQRRPVFLHLKAVRYLGHAGTDAEAGYRSPEEIRASFARDPILATARALVSGGSTPALVIERYRAIGAAVWNRALELLDRPELTTAAEVMAPLAPRRPDRVAGAVGTAAVFASTATASAGEPRTRAIETPRTLAQGINAALAAALAHDPGVVVFGEDVAVKGGVYGVTKGLHARFGTGRVFDTLLDETSILGLALGGAVSGLVPIPEIQYLAYLHNAQDQLRGEAATLSFFSQGAYRNGMVVRIAGYGYQRGFGGHFHNDNAVGVLRDIPGLVVASPARAGDAAAMLTTLAAAARLDGTVSVFLEPIARYHTADLYNDGDRQWLEPLDAVGPVAIGEPRRYGEGRDLTIVTWANGLYMSRRVARRLEEHHGIGCRVIDLRWLAPLPIEAVVAEAAATGRVLVADETRHRGGVGEGIVTGLVEAGFDGVIGRVSSKDSFIPLGDAAQLVLLSETEIEAAALTLMRGHRPSPHRTRLTAEPGWPRRLRPNSTPTR